MRTWSTAGGARPWPVTNLKSRREVSTRAHAQDMGFGRCASVPRLVRVVTCESFLGVGLHGSADGISSPTDWARFAARSDLE